MDRYVSHVQTAKTYYRNLSLRKRSVQHAFVLHGIRGMVLFPLQLVPPELQTNDNAVKLFLDHAENAWLQRVASFLSPRHILNRVGRRFLHLDASPDPIPFPAPIANSPQQQYLTSVAHNSRNYLYAIQNFRTLVINEAMARTLTDGSITLAKAMAAALGARLKSFSIDLLFSWHAFLLSPLTVLTWHNFGLPSDFRQKLKYCIVQELIARKVISPPERSKRPAVLVWDYLLPAQDRLHHDLNVSLSIAAPLLPPAVRANTRPLLVYRYPKANRHVFGSASSIHGLPHSTIRRISSGGCGCHRHDDRHKLDGHVCTLSGDILPTPNLAAHFHRGASYRHKPAAPFGDGTVEHLRDVLRAEFEASVDSACLQWSSAYSVSMDQFTAFSTLVKSQARMCIDSHDFSTPHPPHDLPPLGAHDLSLLADFRRDFIVTVMDKNPQNMVIVCKKHYAQRLLSDLDDAAIFTPVTQESLTTASQAADTLAARLRVKHARKKRQPSKYYGTVKFHKNPVTLRFITDARSSSVISDLSKLLHRMLTAIKPLLRDGTKSLWDLLGISPPLPTFSIDRSARLKTIVDHFNSTVPLDVAMMGPSPRITGFDIERMFTNIPHADLISAMNSLIDNAFRSATHALLVDVPILDLARHTCVLFIPTCHLLQAHWHHPLLSWDILHGTRHVHATQETRGNFYSSADVNTLASFVISNVYVRAGRDACCRQVMGAPMGESPSLALTDLFLSLQEYLFLAQLARFHLSHAHQATPVFQDMAKQFFYTARMADDILSISNPSFSSLLYTTQHVTVEISPTSSVQVKGIYPPYLHLNADQDGYDVPFLDARIHPDPCSPGHLAISAYDKRRGPKFTHLALIRYPHRQAWISRTSKLNIVSTQHHRLASFITSPVSYILEIAYIISYLIYNKGYARRGTINIFKNCLRRAMPSYGLSPKRLLRAVIANIRAPA